MKKFLSLVAIASSISLAAPPVKLGVEALVGYNILSLGDDVGDGITTGSPEAQASMGFAVGPNLTIPLNEQIGLEGGAVFLYDMNRYENTLDAGVLGSNEEEHTISQMSLGLKIQPVFQIGELVKVKVGYEWDMPLGGSVETKRTTTLGSASSTATRESDIVWAPADESDVGSSEIAFLSTHNLLVGASFGILPNLAFTVQGKFALTGSVPHYKANGDLDGAAGSDSNIMAHQIAVGVQLGMF